MLAATTPGSTALKSALATAIVALLVSSYALVQSETKGMAVICNAPVECTECMNVSADQRLARLAMHIDGKLWNPNSKALFQGLANLDGPQKVEQLRTRWAELGLASCPMADLLAE